MSVGGYHLSCGWLWPWATSLNMSSFCLIKCDDHLFSGLCEPTMLDWHELCRICWGQFTALSWDFPTGDILTRQSRKRTREWWLHSISFQGPCIVRACLHVFLGHLSRTEPSLMLLLYHLCISYMKNQNVCCERGQLWSDLIQFLTELGPPWTWSEM